MDTNNTSPIAVKGFALRDAQAQFELFNFERRAPDEYDVVIQIHFCGICHSDIHQSRNEWHNSTYPMVPGHEITGIAKMVGSSVTTIQVGDAVGVGCYVDSCRVCKPCKKNMEQHCAAGWVPTYNGTELDNTTVTYGGYANITVVKEHFVCKLPDGLDLAKTAPLLCAGVTSYAPLQQHNVGPNTRVGIIGLGGVSHMAVQLAAAMGAHVTVISTSESKRADALQLGAKAFLVSTDQEQMKTARDTLDFILDTVSAPHNIADLLDLLSFQGIYCKVGAWPEPVEIPTFTLLLKRITVCGSFIGGMQDTRDMLQFCAKHNITCDIEMIDRATPETLAKAYERVIAGDVKYRFVIDMQKTFA